jgi:hypothetical protein
MNAADQTASTIPPPDSWRLKQCSGCGCVFTHSEWAALPSRRLWVFDGEVLEIAECPGCFSTISVVVKAADEDAS